MSSKDNTAVELEAISQCSLTQIAAHFPLSVFPTDKR